MRDLRFSIRTMVRRPGITCLAVATIALGIGATTAIFSILPLGNFDFPSKSNRFNNFLNRAN